MVDLSTTYMGLELKHPVVPSASPLSESLDKIKRLEDAGAAAIVMYSLFEEQIVGESHLLDPLSRAGETTGQLTKIIQGPQESFSDFLARMI